MTETRIIYGCPAENTGCPSITEVINSALSAGSCYIVRTAPDAVQAQARVAELEQALSEIEAITATESPMTFQWVLRLLGQVNQIARRALRLGRME